MGKNILKNIMIHAMRFFHELCPYKGCQFLEHLKRSFYTYWIKNEFGHFGKESFVATGLYIKNPENIIIGDKVNIGKQCILTSWNTKESKNIPKIIIGNHVSIGQFCHITACNCVEIDDGVLTGRWVTITDNSHGRTDYETLTVRPIKRDIVSKGPVRICRNVWICDKVTILPGVTIGEGAVIGANSVVTKDIPPYSVACGNPAKVVKNVKQNQ